MTDSAAQRLLHNLTVLFVVKVRRKGQAGRNGRFKKQHFICNGPDIELKFELCAVAVTVNDFCLEKCREWQRIAVHVIGTAKTFGALSSPVENNKYNSHSYYLLSLHIFPSVLVFFPSAPFVFASWFFIFPSSHIHWPVERRISQTRPFFFLSSPAPYQRSPCLSSCPSAKSLVDWKQISPVRPPSSFIQSDYSCLDAIGVSLFVFLSFFFLSFFLSVFPPFSLCARACTCSHPSSRGAPRLSGPVRWESVKSGGEWPACKQSASMCGIDSHTWVGRSVEVKWAKNHWREISRSRPASQGCLEF